ncbi:hypothetical protein HOR91_gp23 [Xanthomonas phage phi Xc10]|uniref:dATP/dGTP diphosphohydrolase N-terminal domain-containing protein n=1 Tax=Xanthomonas phage phi Xc10 TaxID=2024237 RepID=A0A249XLD9_9CAUD|nr:hypothetical protein HOR91_gp23 [Xanthomonas phage phi Xc10]ASZ72022.1 hypothetical protein [Xanthomonas phage phi Xc10]
MKITDIRSGMRVQYTGNAPGLIGRRGKVSRVFAKDVEVFFDGRVGASYCVPDSLRQLMSIGGVTTTRREVPMPELNYRNEDERTLSDRGVGLKDDGGKPQARLLHEGVPRALARVIDTLTFGAQKYKAHSWQHVEKALERYQDASYRHDNKRCLGEKLDPETGIHHRAHHIINELFLLELELREEEKARGAE